MKFRFTAALLLSSGPLALAACAGGASSSPGIAPFASRQSLSYATMHSRTTNPSMRKTGLLGDVLRDVLGATPAVRAPSPGWLSKEAKGPEPKLYVSDDSANALYIYSAVKPTVPIGAITNGIDGPVGNVVDATGTLYVANLGNSVTVYPRGKTVPSKTYTVGLSEPTDVAVGTDGTLYVSEFAQGSIVEYAPGSSVPSRTIAVHAVQGVALDSHGDLYASYVNPATGSGGVEKFKPKATVGVDLGIVLGDPGDLKLDRANDLLVADQTADTISFYKPGATVPYGSIPAKYTPFKLALNASENLLYVATGVNVLDIFDAVPNGKLVRVLMSDLQSTSGVSLSPAPPLQ